MCALIKTLPFRRSLPEKSDAGHGCEACSGTTTAWRRDAETLSRLGFACVIVSAPRGRGDQSPYELDCRLFRLQDGLDLLSRTHSC
jgi:hypothetical protein